MGGDIGARLPDFISKTAARQFLLRNTHPQNAPDRLHEPGVSGQDGDGPDSSGTGRLRVV